MPVLHVPAACRGRACWRIACDELRRRAGGRRAAAPGRPPAARRRSTNVMKLIDEQQHDHPEQPADDVGAHGVRWSWSSAGRPRRPRGRRRPSRRGSGRCVLLERGEARGRSVVVVRVADAVDVLGRRSGSSCPRRTGSAGACSAIMLVDLGPRLVALGARRARARPVFIASLIFGSLSCGQLTLPCCEDVLAVERRLEHRLRVGEVLEPARRSGRSRPSPCGTSQNFVYSVSCGTMRKLSLKPSFSIWAWATSAVFLPGSALVAMIRSLSPPVYLPDG